jgi:hypothetical protein
MHLSGMEKQVRLKIVAPATYISQANLPIAGTGPSPLLRILICIVSERISASE